MLSPLNIKNIKKKFDTKVVLDDINLELKKGEIFGLIGLNGVGKTTLIKIILNLLDADSGSVEINGVDSRLYKSRENFAYLPEKFQPSPYLKGEEFLSIFSGKNLEKDKKEIDELVDTLALEKTALKRRVVKYSKGMVQKLGLIGTILSDKDLVILDEPMSGLDPQARIYLKNLLLKYKDKEKTVFFSSHILADIDEICNRIAVLHHGKILFLGTPKEFKEKHSEELLERAFLKEIGL